MGSNLVSSYGTATLVPEREAAALAYTATGGWYAYLGFESSWIANDILVQGNTFSNSHSLKLDRRQDRTGAGIGVGIGNWAFILAYADLTSNNRSDPFGSFSVTHRY